jgi:acyl carrier protein
MRRHGGNVSQDFRQQVVRILNEKLKLNLDPAQVTDDKSIQDLGMSSLHLMKMIYLLEDDFGIRIGTDEILEINTVGELVALLEQKTAPAAP